MKNQPLIEIENLINLFQNPLVPPEEKVTIYLALPHSSSFAMTGKALLKTAARTAMQRLEAMGATTEAREKIGASLDQLEKEDTLWARHAESLAIFASSSVLRCLRLSFALGDSVWIGSEIHILPLLKYRNVPNMFYIVKVEEGHPRFLEVHPEFVKELELEELEGLKDFHDRYTSTAERNSHSVKVTHAVGGGGRGQLVPHGSSQDEHHEEGEEYLHQLAKAIAEKIKKESTPLFLIGTHGEVAQFRADLGYKFEFPSPADLKLSTNLPTTDAEARNVFRSCATAWQLQTNELKNESLLNSYRALKGTGETSEDCEEIIRRARQGMVKALLVRDPSNPNPLPFPQRNSVLRGKPSCANLEGTNSAAMLTLLHHGELTEVLDPGFTAETIAAIFRT